MDEILNLIRYKETFIQNQIDKIISRKDKNNNDKISKLDLRNINNIIKLYRELADKLEEKITVS